MMAIPKAKKVNEDEVILMEENVMREVENKVERNKKRLIEIKIRRCG